MSKIISTRAIRGAHSVFNKANDFYQRVLKEKGPDALVKFPDTAYYLPFIYSMLGLKITKLGELEGVLNYAKGLLHAVPDEKVWLPYLGDVLDSGMATLFAEEIIEALKYLENPDFVKEPWIGFTSDSILREQGIKLVDGRMPGFAALVGAAPSVDEAVKLVRSLQERHILIFIAGNTNGVSIAEQLAQADIQMGWDTFIVPYGKDIYAAIYALNFALRGAMAFGGITPKGRKEATELLLYNKKRVHAFVIALGDVDDEKFATAAGAINFGFPTIADTDIDQILVTGICTYEHVVSPVTLEKIVDKSIEVRGLKIKVDKPPIPVPYGAAFEGERVRKEQLAVEFGGKYSKAFEYLKMRSMDEIENGKVDVVGPDIDTVPDGGSLPLAILIEVAGRKMQKDFETILERRIHQLLSEASGVMHIGQRNMNWIRISKEAKKAGFSLKHFGVILNTKLLSEFPAIVDKSQVSIYTRLEDVEKYLPEAISAYDWRDARSAGMTDESVDIFYSCALCQSYAPNHICIITPERLGLCGAYNWLDGKAAYEINPNGPNQPVTKGAVLDAVKGQWEGVNKAVYEKSNRAVEKFNAYSIMENPMTSCLVAGTEVIIDNKVVKLDGFINKYRGTDEYTKFSALTINKGKIISDKIVAMQKFPAPDRLIKIITKSGDEMVLTSNHKIAIDTENGLQWESAGKIKKGNRIISLKSLKIPEKIPLIGELVPSDFKVNRKKFDIEKMSLTPQLFYLLGLISSDGSINHRGKYEYRIDFINTTEELVSSFCEIYSFLFPKNKISKRIKNINIGKIRGREIKSKKRCYQCYTNNSLFGIIARYYGIKTNPDGSWDIGRMLTLPKEFIANFIAGLFDGDGSVRLRKYNDKWYSGEGYLCIEDEAAARHLQLLLKRLDIVGNIKRSSSVYKVLFYGSNLLKFIDYVPIKHPNKEEIFKKIKYSYKHEKIDKTQSNILPMMVGKKIGSKLDTAKLLSPTTAYYYKAGLSRASKSNVEKIIPLNNNLVSEINNDYFLDKVTQVRIIDNKDFKFDYVYNLTLANIHSYVVNGGYLVKNCGCFECIVGVLPEANGVMVVNRGFAGMTPIGMTFSTLAGSVGGGQQTPGFTGVGRLYLTSKKFLSAEGGFSRIVWMTKELKEELGERLRKRAEDLGTPDFIDKIADETIATTVEDLLPFLQKVDHPALKMPSLM